MLDPVLRHIDNRARPRVGSTRQIDDDIPARRALDLEGNLL
jgi:hypothetical protein